MEANTLFTQFKAKVSQAVDHLREELVKLKTGRAHPAMLDGIMIEAYSTKIPLKQAGSISTPEPQTLQITPFDPGNIQAISSAVRENQALGLNPVDDGKAIRIQIPQLNEERRKEFVKILGSKVEDCMVSLRNARHETIKEAESAKKAKELSEDDIARLHKQIDEYMSEIKTEIDGLSKEKEQEILTV